MSPVITINNKLKFEKHIVDLCKKAFFELHALKRIRRYLTVEKTGLLANAFMLL